MPKQTVGARSISAAALNAQVLALLQQHKLRQGQQLCLTLNRQFPDYEPGWRNGCELALQMNNPQRALQAIQQALRISPNSVSNQLQQCHCLTRLGELKPATQLALQLSDRTFSSAYQCATLALILSRLGHQSLAKDFYLEAIVLEPEQGQHYYNLASVLRFLGDIKGAETNLNKALHYQPDDYDAYHLRSSLRHCKTDDNHIESLETALNAATGNARGQTKLLYALAKENEDIGRSVKSFGYLNKAAAARRSLMSYQIDQELAGFSAIKKHFNEDFFDQLYSDKNHHSCESDQPIFIVGMPRTGSTLVERIVAGHSDVYAAGELNNFAQQMTKLCRGANPGMSRGDLIQHSTRLDFKQLGLSYIDSTLPFTGAKRYFIDKMPINFLYIGLIHAALPNAKIIHVQRHPLDTCYAMYKTLFENMYPFSYDLDELGLYYAAYLDLMLHWQKHLPTRLYNLAYEDLINGPESQARALLSHCNLPWQEQCLQFQQNQQASTTASASQVRQPLYRSSMGRWRDYESQLKPLIARFAQAGIDLD